MITKRSKRTISHRISEYIFDVKISILDSFQIKKKYHRIIDHSFYTNDQ